MLSNKIIGATAAKESLYVDDVASVYLYTGNGSTQTITNNVDLSGEGGLVWIKSRSAATDHQLFDTARGATKELISNSTAAEVTDADTLTAFNADGFSLGADSNTNTNAATYASFTFREQPKFFDIVTYTGNGSASRTVTHSLGSTPGMIIVKRTDSASDWWVYHRGLDATSPQNYIIRLNLTNARAASSIFNDTLPTSTEFYLGAGSSVTNVNGATYVAYLFAHNAGGFGAAGTDNVISCGSYVGNSSATGPVINLGYEPQYILIKDASSDNNWLVQDVMRGMSEVGTLILNPNASNAETDLTNRVVPTSTGFKITSTSDGYNQSGRTYIYMAIRRPMKPPTSGTQVFAPVIATSSQPELSTSFTVDSSWIAQRSGTDKWNQVQRLTGTQYLNSTSTGAPLTFSGIKWDYQTGSGFNGVNGYIGYCFRRAPGFFDVVCYTGTGVARTVAHNLGVAPELMIVKSRSAAGSSWLVYEATLGNTKYLAVNTTAAAATLSTMWNNTTPTSTVFTLGTNANVNQSTATYVAYLFASVAGVSKVGSYTGTAATQTINCGFTAGARFVLIKRTDSTGDWYVWDTARGIVSGNDPYLRLNITNAEISDQDYIDPASSGFEISSTAPNAINASGGNFIFFAVA